MIRFTARWLLAAIAIAGLLYMVSFGRGFTVDKLRDFRHSEQSDGYAQLFTDDAAKTDELRKNVGKQLKEAQAALEAQDIAAVMPAVPAPLPQPSHNYTRALVMPHTEEEDIAWIYSKELRADTLFYRVPYSVDNPSARYTVPINKGREAMAYLTYIIDHYTPLNTSLPSSLPDTPYPPLSTPPTSFSNGTHADSLPDVSIFMHAHRHAWHNNDLLDSDSMTMLSRLNIDYVLRTGYVNLRCHLPDDGCAHLHPAQEIEFDETKPEQTWVAEAWREIFPERELPENVGAPCCSQFALSRATIRSVPLAKYIHLRDWLASTDITEGVSGRIFEFVWHVVFTERDQYCPATEECYCKTYDVCFESGHEGYEEWARLYDQWMKMAKELHDLLNEHIRDHGDVGIEKLARMKYLHDVLGELRVQMDLRKFQAWDYGVKMKRLREEREAAAMAKIGGKLG